MDKTFESLNDVSFSYLNHLIENNPDDFNAIMDRFHEPRFSVAQIGISRQELLNWKKQGLIPQIASIGNVWVRVSYFTYAWIRMVAELRKLNVPITTIKKFADKILEVNEDEYYAILQESLSFTNRSILPLKIQDIEDYAAFVNTMPQQVKQFFRDRYNNFSLLVLGAIFNQINVTVFLDKDGDFCFSEYTNEKNQEYWAEYKQFVSRPFYALPLAIVLSEFEENEKVKQSDIQALFQLNEREVKILSLIRRDGIKEVRIRLNKTNGKAMFLVEVVEEKNIALTQSKIEKILKKGEFKDYRISTQDGNLVLFEETTKIKI